MDQSTNKIPLSILISDYEEGNISKEKMLDLFQRLVDNGLVWTLQGHYGRMAAGLIQAGLIKDKGETTHEQS